jgi:hypothetical protein
LKIRFPYVGVFEMVTAASERKRTVPAEFSVYVWNVGIETADVAEFTESQVAEVLVAPPPKQSVVPEATVNVPFPEPGPVGFALRLSTPEVTLSSAPEALFIVTAAPSFITVALLLMISLWKVVAAESRVGVPLADVTETVPVP